MANEELPHGITRRGRKFRVSVMVNGIRRTATEDTLEAAKATADFLRGQIRDKGEDAATAEWTLQEAGDHYVSDHLIPSGMKDSTVVAFRSRLRPLTRFFGGDCKLASITHPRLISYMKHRREVESVSLNAIAQELHMVSYLMGRAKKLGGYTGPIPQLPTVKIRRGRMRYVTDAEEDLMLTYFATTSRADCRDAVVCLLDTGLRVRVEMLALAWKDVDLKARRVHVWDSKGDTPRSVPMTSRVFEILSRRKLSSANQAGPFSGLRYDALLRGFVDFRVHAGLQKDNQFTLHVLRHTFCTRLAMAGVDLNTIRVLAGHKNIQTTMAYVQFVPSTAQSAIEALERVTEREERGVAFEVVKGGKR